MFFPTKTTSALLASTLLLLSSAMAETNSSLSLAEVPEGIFEYHEIVGDKTIPFSWEAERKQDKIAISVFEEEKYFYNLCTADGATLKWRIKVEGVHDLTAIRKNNTLHIEGTRFGEEYSEQVTIDERPWYQPLSFSLGSFLDSDEQKTSFWVIRADKIDVIALTAEKVGEEDIFFNEEVMVAQMIEIRAEGFRSRFWHATYWYRKSDNLFLRYESVHGLPGTSATIVKLVETPRKFSDS
jgi:hypothetical protein